jgi:hypothetical protein
MATSLWRGAYKRHPIDELADKRCNILSANGKPTGGNPLIDRSRMKNSTKFAHPGIPTPRSPAGKPTSTHQ